MKRQSPFIPMLYVCIISPKRSSALNTCSNDFIHRYTKSMTSHKRKIASGVAVRDNGGVASEEQVVSVPKFHYWVKCTMPLMNINSDWTSNASSGLCIILVYNGPLQINL